MFMDSSLKIAHKITLILHFVLSFNYKVSLSEPNLIMEI